LPASFVAPQPKTKAPQPPTKSNSNKNAKKKEHNADKREVLQVHVTQIQTLQNEFKSMTIEFANLKDKSSQRASHAQLVQGL
jgi:hypothetical protein